MSAKQPAPFQIVALGSFDRRRRKRLSDVAYEATETPDVGDVMPRTGGFRKVRWAETGQGKSGGVRIIYLYRSASGTVFLLDIYAKNDKTSLSRAEQNALARIAATLL